VSDLHIVQAKYTRYHDLQRSAQILQYAYAEEINEF